jgi:hypothetical protein
MADLNGLELLKAQHDVLAAMHSRISVQIVMLCEEIERLPPTWWGSPSARHRQMMGEVRGLHAAAQLAFQMALAKASEAASAATAAKVSA